MESRYFFFSTLSRSLSLSFSPFSLLPTEIRKTLGYGKYFPNVDKRREEEYLWEANSL